MANILAADIGGTNSRFAHFEVENGNLRLIKSVWLQTREAASFEKLIGHLSDSDLGLKLDQASIVALGVPGPVRDGVYCKPPYIPWDIDLTRDMKMFSTQRVTMLNDFVAQAYAFRTPVMAQAKMVVPGEPDNGATIALIGAGSNLGHAALVPGSAGRYYALASEYGQAEFNFHAGMEAQYCEFLENTTGESQPTNDVVVSGRGLKYLHLFLTGEDLSPSSVEAGLEGDSETLVWMSRFYGRASRQWALAVLALGGVYITGGIAARCPEMITHPEFSREFREKSRSSDLLGKVPVFLNLNQESGLWGAAAAALERLGR